MARPFLTLNPATNPTGVIDFTALTCKGGVFDDSQGYTQADWVQFGFTTSSGTRKKKEGGNQVLTMSPFVAAGDAALTSSNSTFLAGGTWTAADEAGNAPAHDMSNSCRVYNIPSGQINCGVRYTKLYAPYGLKKHLQWVGKVVGGTYIVTASLSDGSVGAESMTLPANSGFTLDWMGAAKDSIVTLTITRTVSSGAGNIFPQIAWIELPVPIVPPSGLKKYLFLRGITGGPHV